MLEKLGLGFVLGSDSTRLQADMGRARDAFGRFTGQAQQVPPGLARIAAAAGRTQMAIRAMSAAVGAGMMKISGGMQNIGLGAAPLALGMGAAIKTAATFEHQMSAVAAVTRATADEEKKLGAEARRMGIVSVFTATQAGEGMENLGRAGANADQIISALQGTMNMAAADGMDLGKASAIVARVVKGMGMEWGDAAHIADSLALASTKVNTNIEGIGEAFTYGVSSARALNLSMEETTSTLAAMADTGITGSMAGTAFTNMMTKMAKPTAKAQKYLETLGVTLENNDGSLKKISTIVDQVQKGLQSYHGVTKKLAIEQEIFGRRGARAYASLATKGKVALDQLTDDLINSSKGVGAATEMANKRLDNMIGKWILLKSSLQGLAIGMFGPMLKTMATDTGKAVDLLNGVLFALEGINDAMAIDDKWDRASALVKVEDAAKKVGPKIMSIALGIRDAIDSVGRAYEWVKKKFSEGKTFFDKYFGEDSTRNITKMIVLFTFVLAALAPIILAGMMIGWVISGIVSVVSGLIAIISAVGLPLLAIGGLLYLLFLDFQKGGETTMETFVRLWDTIKTAMVNFYNETVLPFWDGFMAAFGPALTALELIWTSVWAVMVSIFETTMAILGYGADNTEDDWRDVGVGIGAVFGVILNTISFIVLTISVLLHGIVTVVAVVVKIIVEIFAYLGNTIGEMLASVWLAWSDIFGGNMVRGLKRLGLIILDTLLKPLRMVLEGMIAIAEAAGMKVDKKVKKFAVQGITDMVFNVGARKEGKTNTHMKDFQKNNPMPDLSKWKIPKMASKGKAVRAAPPKFDVKATVEDKRKIELENKMCIDGEGVNVASGRAKVELDERAGSKATPYQRRTMLERGAIPTPRVI